MNKFIFTILTCLSLSSAYGCTEVDEQFLPKQNISTIDLCRTDYQVAYSLELKSPIWVGETLTAEEISAAIVRVNMFRADPTLNHGERAELADYSDSGYDRGHLFSALDSSSEKAMEESFYLSNMVPQLPANNRGIWNQLERRVRDMAVKQRKLIIFSGPVFVRDNRTIGDNHIPVPMDLFKVIYDPTTQTVLTFIIPNQKVSNFKHYVSNLKTLAEKTGLTFFAGQPVKELNYIN
jgi:endonuclease G